MKAYFMDRWSRGVQHASVYERPTVVALDFHSQVNFTDKLTELCGAHSCNVHIFDKNATCKAYESFNITCESMPLNLGLDAASALQYVVDHYDALPTVVIFVPTNDKWNRLRRVQYLVQSDDASFDCLRDDARRLPFEGPRIFEFKKCLFFHGFSNASELFGMPNDELLSEWSLQDLMTGWTEAQLGQVREACRLPGELYDYWPLIDVSALHESASAVGTLCNRPSSRPLGLELLSDCANFTVQEWAGIPLAAAAPEPLVNLTCARCPPPCAPWMAPHGSLLDGFR
jgi:hypothetical protein